MKWVPLGEWGCTHDDCQKLAVEQLDNKQKICQFTLSLMEWNDGPVLLEVDLNLCRKFLSFSKNLCLDVNQI